MKFFVQSDTHNNLYIVNEQSLSTKGVGLHLQNVFVI